MSKTIKLEIVATGHKLNEDDSLIVLIDPRHADIMEDIYRTLVDLTGHERHSVIPVPKEAIKIFSVQHPITIGVNQDAILAPAVTEGEQTNE